MDDVGDCCCCGVVHRSRGGGRLLIVVVRRMSWSLRQSWRLRLGLGVRQRGYSSGGRGDILQDFNVV